MRKPSRKITRAKVTTTLETALELKPNSICNAIVTAAAAEFYSFQATKGKKLIVDCTTADIDSRLIRVLIITDAQGRDFVVNRRGGTHSNPKNIYRLITRKAAPDFALVAWAFDAPNGPNYAQVPARPIALRGGGTMALQVAALRRDGFDGDIDLIVEGLPVGMTATGLKIPAGKTQGMILFTAIEKAARAVATVKLSGRAQINGASVSRPCSLASIVWPVPNTAQEIPRGRLLDDVPVSISGFELSPLTIAPKENKVFEAKAGAKLNIPLALTWRGDHTTALKLKALTLGFEAMKETDIAVKAAGAEAVLDLAVLMAAVSLV